LPNSADYREETVAIDLFSVSSILSGEALACSDSLFMERYNPH